MILYIGLAETELALQILIDIVHNYSKHWRFEANVKKCATVVFFKNWEAFVAPGPPASRVGLG